MRADLAKKAEAEVKAKKAEEEAKKMTEEEKLEAFKERIGEHIKPTEEEKIRLKKN